MGSHPANSSGEGRPLTVGEVELELFEGGDGPPLIVLHGFLEAPSWGEHHELLAQKFHVLAPSHPGFGETTRPDWMESIDDLANFYLDFIEAAGLPHMHLLGHSFGGWIAVELAVRCCHKIDRLILVDAVGLRTLPTPIGPAGGSIADWLIMEPAEVRALAWHEASTGHVLRLPGDPDLTEEELVAIFRNREAVSQFGWEPFFFNPRLNHWLHRVDVPTLVIWGEHDGIVPRAVGQAYVDGIPDARLEIIPATAHLPHLERPKEFADAVLRFLG